MPSLVTRGAMIGALSGLCGVAAMTAAEKLEQAITHRPDSEVPGRALARMFGRDPQPRSATIRRFMWGMHVGAAVSVGIWRGLMAAGGLRGPWASGMFTVVRLSVDQTAENLTGVGAPPGTWPRLEAVVDVTHKAVYAFTTGFVADRLAGRYPSRPGEAHAARLPGRHANIGPVAE